MAHTPFCPESVVLTIPLIDAARAIVYTDALVADVPIEEPFRVRAGTPIWVSGSSTTCSFVFLSEAGERSVPSQLSSIPGPVRFVMPDWHVVAVEVTPFGSLAAGRVKFSVWSEAANLHDRDCEGDE